MKKRFTLIIIVILLFIIIFHPGRHAKYYNYVSKLNVFNELLQVSEHNHNDLKFCSTNFYSDLIINGYKFYSDDIYSLNNFTRPNLGGEYFPPDCRPIFECAVIVPYRNRPEQLALFLKYMHTFLQRQKIHYRIFIVDQKDKLAFNRAKMLNIGAAEAIKMNFACLILHDVDLFPLNLQNIYTCSKQPRHMSSSIDTLRFNLPYLGLSGGAFAIQSKHFEEINGMSNEYYGWGGEDDDFFNRLEEHNLLPYRFPPEISEYSMLFHKKEKASNERYDKLKDSLNRHNVDGLNSLSKTHHTVLKPLFTHVVVE